tara:strand:- start:601 stop:1224 length:624 start_codon:yes stop_codon:yes gene_type:complete
MYAKICGVKNSDTLKYIINHDNSPKFVGFITNYKKSKRYLDFKDLKKLINVDKKKTNFVSVLVNPDEDILEKIKNLKFDYYQLYDVSPEKTKIIKEKYNKKIISAITVKSKSDVEKYKNFNLISDIILFDSKGYEKSIGFDYTLLNDVPNSITKMLAGNIQYDDMLAKYSKITDIIDISGSLETSGEKDISKINFFLENISKIKNEN